MGKQSLILGGVAVVAIIVAGYMWQQLRHERDTNASARFGPQPVPQLSPPATAEVQQISPAPQAVAPPPLPPAAPSQAAAPIYYGPEFDRILKNQRPDRNTTPIVRMHTAMELETRDPEWAPVMEDEWQKLMAGKQQLSRYGIPTIECRATTCEIRILANGVSEEEFKKAMDQPGSTPSAKFTPMNTMYVASDNQNGATAYVMVVSHTRAPPQKAGP